MKLVMGQSMEEDEMKEDDERLANILKIPK